MRATMSLTAPPKFLPPVNSPPVHHQPPSAPAPLHAISIAVPDIQFPGLGRTNTAPDVDESPSGFRDYQSLFVSQRSETVEPVAIKTVDGSIPADFPSGTYYLAGPGLFTDDHGSTVHPLDGHGYLRAFKIDGREREATFMAKYVRTEAQMEEHDPVTDTWRFTHRGPFSVLKGGKKFGNTKVMKNVANTSVLKWGDRLLCLWEGGEPYEIESETLDTIGRSDVINGCDFSPENCASDAWDTAAKLLKPILNGVFKMPPKRFLSHYKMDTRRNRLLTVSCNSEDMLLPRSNFTFCEFDEEFKLVHTREFKIPDHMMIHDWAFTESHYILFANRVKLNPIGSVAAVCGMSPMISALSLNPSNETSPIYILPRFSGGSVGGRDWRVPIEAPSQLWLIHAGNAFETRDNSGGGLEIEIQASACSYLWFDFQKMFGYNWQSGKLDPSIMNRKQGNDGLLPHLVKVSISLDVDGSCKSCDVEPLNGWNKPSDFPVVNSSCSGQKNRYIYSASSSGSRSALPDFPFDTVVKFDLDAESVRTWSTGARRFIGEPMFVSRGSNEEDGYIIVVEYAVSIERCYLVILDVKKIGEADALVARLEVPRNLTFPMGFHGLWTSD
ncbi:PREDICTED: carotenoid cleavage dioxygenase 7, chloroplastic [Tarenaya hassleriana]|uniref:carotenoid cleavage dioxygenase 7, chloroplastic n=1 Tax=Tarenaya hassleriana TaxID=28532 RepID=UPI00053C9360|nr:PREDICTED: carotenoid cleavage dioxygenase 7, chloroplastic [Tarenaya hassleriana]